MMKSAPPKPDRASLASHLLYDSFDPDGEIFIHRDGSMAISWRIGMKDAEVASPGELRALADRMSDCFRHLPANAAAQFIMIAEQGVKETLGRFRGAGGPHPILGALFEEHGRMLDSMSIPYAGTTFTARTLRLFFTLRVFPEFAGPEEEIRHRYGREKKLLVEHALSIESFFTQIGISSRRAGAQEILELLYRMLNPERAAALDRPRLYREDRPLRDQIVRSAVRFDYDSGVIEIGGRSTKVLSMVEIPLETSPGMLSRPDASGVGVLDLIPDAVLVFNMGVLDDSLMRRAFEKRDAFAWRQLQGPRKKLQVLKIKEDAEAGLDQITNGKRAFSVRFHVLLSGISQEAVRLKARTMIQAADRLGIDMVEEDAYALSLFLQSLPMMYHPESDRGLKRAFIMMSPNVADMIPLYGSYQGTRTPELLLQNRRGELIFFSPFDSDVAPHVVVTGVSGAGKSFLMNYALASAVRAGAHIIILDKGNSYRNLCELVGGQYVVFDPNRPLRINPIGRAEEMDKERLLFVKDILAEMCAQGEEPIRKEERTVLENAVLRAVGWKKSGEVLLSDVYRALLEEVKAGPRSLGRDLDRLTLALKPFVQNGAYAGFFDGTNEIDFRRNFTVFELGEIAKRREIASTLLMAIMANAATFCGAPENLAIKKYLVIDEAWSLLQSPATARFIEEALRTFRKLNAAAVMVTQQVADFYGEAGTAIRANAPNRIFLRQTAETVLAMEKLFELPPEVKGAIAGLVTAKGRFSEMFIDSTSGRGIARLVPSRELYTAFSTDGNERARLRELVVRNEKEGNPEPLLAAIRELSGMPGTGGAS